MASAAMVVSAGCRCHQDFGKDADDMTQTTLPTFTIRWRSERYAVCRFDSTSVQRWALEHAPEVGPGLRASATDQPGQPDQLISVTRTGTELSVIAPEAMLPTGIRCIERGFVAASLEGPLDFALVGVLARLAGALADAGISMLAVGSFDTDHVLVRERDLERAKVVLGAAGFVEVDAVR